ncbi:MAG: hypothetical protein CL536_08640 [Alcaligenaceae bacterium]|jgi:hypothetical protein|nr:hypothetical protein [Alcaligenaceae bacterium]|tara:strand:+ start:3372 stop:3680 length:309 start_codon:yes stop_codon:yes gene_type:complete
MSQFAKLILLPSLVVFSLLAAPGVMRSPSQVYGQENAAHHHDVEHGLSGHGECATIACCLMPANAGREMLLDRVAELVDTYPVLYMCGEGPRVPAPPPKPLV